MNRFEAFDDHQRRAIALLDDVLGGLAAGMTERDVAALAESRRAAHGFDRWFHAPIVDIDARYGLLARREHDRLAPGVPITIDLAPATAAAFGDVAVTVVFGGGADEIVDKAREVCRATCGYASHWKTIGELWVYAHAWANNRQCRLADERSVGHACLPPGGALRLGWPRSAHVATRLRRHQIGHLNPRRLRGVFAVRVPLTDGRRVAVFEEMIAVDDTHRRVLGRDGTGAIAAYASLSALAGASVGTK